jgi:hypothetical protein
MVFSIHYWYVLGGFRTKRKAVMLTPTVSNILVVDHCVYADNYSKV